MGTGSLQMDAYKYAYLLQTGAGVRRTRDFFPERVGYLNYARTHTHTHTRTHRSCLGLSLLLALLALLSASVLVYLVE